MALVYTEQPVTKSQKSAQAYAGEVDLNGNWFILDADGIEVLYIRLRPGLPSDIAARVAETAAIADAIMITLNAM